MSEFAVIAAPDGIQEFSSPENLNRVDSTVSEIFEMMFGLRIAAVPDCSNPAVTPEAGERTAIVGFSGSMRGSCQIRASSTAAESIASAMLGGLALDGNDESINDALGELCNMLAGSWKNSIVQLSSQCTLSPPTIVVGLSYRIQMGKPSSRLCRSYKFGEHMMNLTLYREEPTSR